MQLRSVGQLPLAGRKVTELAISGDYVAWLEGLPRKPPDAVRVWQLSTGRVETVATIDPNSETISPVRVADRHGGAELVYTHISASSSAGPGAAGAWQVIEVDVKAGKKTVLASSGRAVSVTDAPAADLNENWVSWAEAGAVGTADIKAVNLNTRRGETVARGVHPDNVWVSRDAVVFDDTLPNGSADVYSVATDGTTPAHRITSSGHVAFVIARDGALAWQEPPGRDPDSEWYERPGESAIRVGTSNAGNAVPTAHAVAWLDDSGLVARLTVPALGAVVAVESGAQLSVAARWDADADRLVWATVSSRGDPSELDTIKVAALGG